MTFQQLTYVVEVSKCGSINKAAHKLFLSQSGISTAVRELEEELGIKFFVRSNRGVEFTPEGKEFLGYAVSLLEQKQRIESLYGESRSTIAPVHFSVSTQRYPFTEDAFLEMLQQNQENRYQYTLKETSMDGVIDVLNYVPETVTLPLEPERINALLGTDIPEADMIEYLRREEVPVVDGMIQVPSWRPDLRVMADIAEEVARYYGYNNIETTLMRGATTMGGYSDAQKLENAAGAAARAMGYSEIITYSFVSPASFISPSYYDKIRMPKDSPLRKSLKILNPLGEDTSIMRTVILPSMLDILSRNFAFKNKGVKLYEIGKIYLPKDGEKLPDEPKRMIFGTYGEHENFFTLKGEIDAILDQLNVHPAAYIADTKNPSYHPGRCADIIIDGKKLGVIGQTHPLVAEGYGIDGEVYVAELDFTGLQAALAPERVFHSLPKFPTVSRDLALVCDEAMTVGMLEACIKKAGGKLLRSIQLFDIYRGPGIAPGKKSIAFSLELRADDRTLTDEDTTGVMNAVLEKLKNDLGVSLR